MRLRPSVLQQSRGILRSHIVAISRTRYLRTSQRNFDVKTRLKSHLKKSQDDLNA